MFEDTNTLLILGIVIGGIVLLVIVSSLLPDSSKVNKQALLKKSNKELAHATKMVQDGYYPQAVIHAHKCVEQAMKAVTNAGVDTSFDLLKQMEKTGKLSKLSIDKAHQLRRERNKAAHGEANINEPQARVMLSNARSIINQLLA